MTSSTHGCSGNHAKRLSGPEDQVMSWNIRNFHSAQIINIDRVRIKVFSWKVFAARLPTA